MTKQPESDKDWIAKLKEDIEANDTFRGAKAVFDIRAAIEENDDYRLAKAFGADKRAAVKHFTKFFDDLIAKAERGEHIDPKAFEKEVRNYPDRISATIIADILYEACMQKHAIRQMGDKILEDGLGQIERRTNLAIDIAETRIRRWFEDRFQEQQERLALIEEMMAQQDINLMRAVTLKEQAEALRYRFSWSPVTQYQSIRNAFRRHALLKEAERAFHDYSPKTVGDLVHEARRVQCETQKEFEAEIGELKAAFDGAKEKIVNLDHCDMDIFDARLRGAIDECRDRFTMARFQILHTSKGLER